MILLLFMFCLIIVFIFMGEKLVFLVVFILLSTWISLFWRVMWWNFSCCSVLRLMFIWLSLDLCSLWVSRWNVVLLVVIDRLGLVLV